MKNWNDNILILSDLFHSNLLFNKRHFHNMNDTV